MDITPTSEKTNSPNVGVYLHNQSDWDVIADVKFEVDDCKREVVKQRFGRKDSPTHAWGFPDMVPHHRCTNGDLLSDGNFQLEVSIELDDEEVLPHHNVEDEVSKSHVDEKFEEMKKIIENKFIGMEQRMASIEIGNNLLMTRLDVIGRKIFTQPPGGFSSSSSSDLECPICAETLRRPMRLHQCGQVGSKFCC